MLDVKYRKLVKFLRLHLRSGELKFFFDIHQLFYTTIKHLTFAYMYAQHSDLLQFSNT